MMQEIGLDADNLSEDSMRRIFCVEHDGSVMTKRGIPNHGEEFRGKPGAVTTERTTAQVWGTTATVAGIYHERGLHANKPYHRRGRFIDTWMFKNKNWVCVAAQATLLQP